MERLAITVKEAAQMLGIGMNRMYDLVHREDFPVIQVGTRLVIPLDPFRCWVNREGVKKGE